MYRGLLFVDPARVFTKQRSSVPGKRSWNPVWSQLKQAVNYDGHVFLTDEMLHSYYLDGDILDVPRIRKTAASTKHRAAVYFPKSIAGCTDRKRTPRFPTCFGGRLCAQRNTQLATMEGANEAASTGRQLHHRGYRGSCAPLCKIYRLPIPWADFC